MHEWKGSYRAKEIGDEEPYYRTKSLIWAGLAALHKASTIHIMKVVQS